MKKCLGAVLPRSRIFCTPESPRNIAFLSACPKPYIKIAGDVPGTGIKQMVSINDMDTCSEHCDSTTDCCSFEFSPKERFCNLNAECKPTGPVNKDEIFCGKGKQFFRNFFSQSCSSL